MGEQGSDFLPGGTPQVEVEADGLVYSLTNVFGKLIELGTLEIEFEKIEFDFSPGNQQESQEEIVGLAVITAGDGLPVHAVDGAKDADQMVAAARAVMHFRDQLSLVDGKELGKEVSVNTEFKPFGSNGTVNIIEGFVP